MRKYQQCALLLLSAVSIAVLLLYKKENNRLKYVLDVVNFFGRQDAVLETYLTLENSTKLVSVHDLGTPLASWQWLGSDFHAYSAFWRQQQESMSGGEVAALVVGLSTAAVEFKCYLELTDRSRIKGKFGFIRIEHSTTNDNFNTYKFLCKYENSRKSVAGVVFTDIQSSVSHRLAVRNLQERSTKDKMLLAVCLDLNSYNGSLDTFINATTLLQFFYHYHIIGAEEFIVYGADYMNTPIRAKLLHHGIQPNVFPYNFPFDANNKRRQRAIIETDCLLRTSNAAQFTIVASLNEFFYPNSKFAPDSDFMEYIGQFSADTNRFEIETLTICLDARKRVLSDNLQGEVAPSMDRFFLHRPAYSHEGFKSVEVSSKQAMLNRYSGCDTHADLLHWRSLVSEKHLAFIHGIGRQLNLYLAQ